MRSLSTLSAALNATASMVEAIHDEAERASFRRGVATMMTHLVTDLQFPIIKQHPSLDPDR